MAKRVRGINKNRTEFLRQPLHHSTSLSPPAFSDGGTVCWLRVKNRSRRKDLAAKHMGVIQVYVNGICPDKIDPLLPFYEKAHHLTPGGHDFVPVTRGIKQLAV